jgi:hypothetical protein
MRIADEPAEIGTRLEWEACMIDPESARKTPDVMPDKQLAEFETTVQRAAKIIKKSRREIQRSRDLLQKQKKENASH